MSFVAEHFKELDFFSSNFNLTIMSFCTQGLPKVAESTLAISEGCPSPWGEGARQGG